MKWLKRVLLAGLVMGVVVAAVVWYCNYKVTNTYAAYLHDDITEVDSNRVGLLPGTIKTLKSGNANPFFTYRINAAAELFKAGKIERIVISGDHSRNDYNEPEDMKQALIAQGIPDSCIYLDYAGFDTYDSMVRCYAIFGQRNFTVITQKFQNERAVFIARRMGLKAIGYNAKDVGRTFGFGTLVREKFARVKMYYDLLMKVNPKFYGEQINVK
jgi:SanA protein